MRYSEMSAKGEDPLGMLVAGFSDAMKDKLDTKSCEDWQGWDDPGAEHSNNLTDAGWSVEEIRARIRAQLDKPDGGDPVDIANYCAFWWNLLQGESDEEADRG